MQLLDQRIIYNFKINYQKLLLKNIIAVSDIFYDSLVLWNYYDDDDMSLFQTAHKLWNAMCTIQGKLTYAVVDNEIDTIGLYQQVSTVAFCGCVPL